MKFSPEDDFLKDELKSVELKESSMGCSRPPPPLPPHTHLTKIRKMSILIVHFWKTGGNLYLDI